MNAILLTLAATDGAHTGWYVHPAIAVIVNGGILLLGLCMLFCIYRLIRGPHLADRSLAVDTLGVMLVGLVSLFVLKYEALGFIDGVLVLSLLSFAGTVALAQYIARPHMRKKQDRAEAESVDGHG